MVSVLIPVYRFDVSPLVEELQRQIAATGIPFEILLQDDGSPAAYWNQQKALAQSFPCVSPQANPTNLGRSATRNKLLERAQYEWIWFLDCDADARVNAHLFSNFWEQKSKHQLLSGGRIYAASPPDEAAYYLHWLWGSKRELLDPQLRMRDPVNHFLSNNFFCHKYLFETVQFEARIQGYGYEDTLFAAELEKAGFQIVHIANPVMHVGLDKVEAFLEKIRESLHNLIKVQELLAEKQVRNPIRSKLFRTYQRLKPFSIFLRPFAKSALPLLEKRLKSKQATLGQFDMWRILYLVSLP